MSESYSKSLENLEKKIQKMEALLLHSACGFHALFKNQDIKQAIQNLNQIGVHPNSSDRRQKIEALIHNLIEQPSLQAKIQYLSKLDQESYSLVVITYLEILESALKNLHPHRNIH